jgi:uncharacterized protein YodC (DUF2158 family)
MADAIKSGDVVQLKSGGPKMTVENVYLFRGEMRARCAWFIDDKNHSDTFPVGSLKKVD